MEELNEKLNKINDIKGQIKDSIVNKKGTITDETPFEDYPKAIDELPSGGGGEKIFAHYVDTDIAEGKKVMMTRTTSQAVPDTEFCNGYIPYFINDGIAYCSTTSGSGYGYLSNVTPRLIVDGKVSNESSVNLGTASDFTGYQPFVQSCCGGKSVVFGSYNSSSYKYPKRFGIYTGSVYKNDGVANGYYTTITDNFFAWVDDYSSYITKFFHLQPLQQANATLTALKFSQTNKTNMAFMFERESDNGKALYRLYSNKTQAWENCGLEKYDLETNIITTLDAPYVSIETTLTHRGNISVQTKDCKYIIYPNGYVFLDLPVDGGGNGFAIREYPQQIKDAIGDRTVLTVQAFYDNYFALMLSDGATLMCNYYNNYGVADGDLMKITDVEEIEPFKIPDDDTVYQRLYSGDRLFWFLSTINRKSPTADKNPAGPFDQENNTSSWFASEPSSIRFNSTVITGFMTGESKTENGRQLVEVKTVTE